MKGYITIGSVRGWCGHVHRTELGAVRCLARDRRGCRGQGGYSDRNVVNIAVRLPSDLRHSDGRGWYVAGGN